MVLPELPNNFFDGVVLPPPTLEPHPDQDLVALDGGVEPAHQPFNGVHIIVQDVGAPGCGIKPVHVLLQAFHPSRCWTAGATRSCTGRDGSQQCSNSVGRDQEASNCSTCCAGDEADARPTRCTPQQPAPSPGLQEAEVKMGFEASKASMHALEAGCVGQERVGHLIEQVEGVKRAVALCRGESRRVRYQRHRFILFVLVHPRHETANTTIASSKSSLRLLSSVPQALIGKQIYIRRTKINWLLT